jgi:AcrR family transcriptional regulator
VQDAPPGKGPSDPAASGLDPLRSRAIEAMAAAVAEHGYARVTVEEVLRRAGMSRRTFYRLYENRDECFLDTYEAVRDATLARIEGNSLGADNTCEGIERPLRAVLQYLAERPEHAHVLVTEPASAGAPSLQAHAETLDALREHLAPALTGAGNGSGDLASTAAVGAVFHVVQQHLMAGELERLPAAAPQLARILVRLGA